MHANTERMAKLVTEVAEDICHKIVNATGDQFIRDQWQRSDYKGDKGGGGITRIIKSGKTLESGAVNTSVIYGEIDPKFAGQLQGESTQLEAAGVSLIFHPKNPNVPTVHMNFRYIRQGEQQWFGGGADLTPYLPAPGHFRYFHRFWKEKLDPFGDHLYPKMKQECDSYFYLPHRKEMRGIGGIFYDYVGVDETNWQMVETLALSFIDSYLPILKETLDKPYSEEDRSFQLYRRGRYVEFNLIYDRGTIFGLKTNGRVESILASLPPLVRYEYSYSPESDSIYAEMLQYYQPRDWVGNN